MVLVFCNYYSNAVLYFEINIINVHVIQVLISRGASRCIMAFIFWGASDFENFSRLVNLPFLFVLRKVTVLRGLVNLGDKTLKSTQLGSSGFFFSSDVAKSRSELYEAASLTTVGEDFLSVPTHNTRDD